LGGHGNPRKKASKKSEMRQRVSKN
jgi:hypothetical protein